MRLLLSGALLLLLVFSGCLDQIFVSPDQTPNAVACDAFTDSTSKDTCYKDKAAAEKNGSYCENITSPTTKDACWSGLADASTNGSFCLQVNDFATQKLCANAHPEAFDATAKCVALQSTVEQQNCYRHVARLTKDPII